MAARRGRGRRPRRGPVSDNDQVIAQGTASRPVDAAGQRNNFRNGCARADNDDQLTWTLG